MQSWSAARQAFLGCVGRSLNRRNGAMGRLHLGSTVASPGARAGPPSRMCSNDVRVAAKRPGNRVPMPRRRADRGQPQSHARSSDASRGCADIRSLLVRSRRHRTASSRRGRRRRRRPTHAAHPRRPDPSPARAGRAAPCSRRSRRGSSRARRYRLDRTGRPGQCSPASRRRTRAPARRRGTSSIEHTIVPKGFQGVRPTMHPRKAAKTVLSPASCSRRDCDCTRG